MAATVVSICNGALSLMGADRISSITENTEEAVVCNDRYEHVRDSVLQLYPWNCCIFRRILSIDVVAPAFVYRYQFVLPTSPRCLTVISVEETDDWIIENEHLVTDSDKISIVYLGRVTDASKYPPHLAELISSRLATEISYKLVGDVQIQQMCTNVYNYKLREAIEIDSKHGGMPRTTDDVYVDTWLRGSRS